MMIEEFEDVASKILDVRKQVDSLKHKILFWRVVSFILFFSIIIAVNNAVL